LRYTANREGANWHKNWHKSRPHTGAAMPLNSRRKGARGELEWAATLRALGFPAARRGQQHRGGPESPDVAGGIPGTHCEVKRVERLNLYDAIEQAVRDAEGRIPYVAHRRNRSGWLITLRADDITAFAKAVLEGLR